MNEIRCLRCKTRYRLLRPIDSKREPFKWVQMRLGGLVLYICEGCATSDEIENAKAGRTVG